MKPHSNQSLWYGLLVIGLALMAPLNKSYTQDSAFVDSVVNVINTQEGESKIYSYRELFKSYIYVNPEKAKAYLDTAATLARRIDHLSLIARTTNDRSVYLVETAEYQQALAVSNEAIDICREIGDSTQLNMALNNKGLILAYLGRYRQAMETHLESLRIKESQKLTDVDDKGVDFWNESIAASYWNIGNLEGDLGNHEKSSAYYQKAMDIYKPLGLVDDVEILKENIAINLKETGEYDAAISMFKESIKYLKSHNYYSSLCATYDNLGMSYYHLDSLSQANFYLNKALELKDKHQDIALTGLNLRHIGDVLMKKKNHTQALDYFQQSLKISEDTHAKKQLPLGYLRTSQAQAALGNYKTAYKLYEKYTAVYKEIQGKENMDKFNELEILYDTERKEKDLIIEKDKVVLLEKEAQVGRLQRWLLGSSLLLSLAALGFGFYAFRQKSKRAKQEQAKVEAELDFKKKELATHALHLAKKNEMLKGLKQKASELKDSSEEKTGYRKLIRTINFDLQDDNNWENFANYFQQVHKDFNQNATRSYPDITPNELRLISLVKMNLSIKEMANILNISVAGVKKARQRLRKKMNLSTKDSLEVAVMGI